MSRYMPKSKSDVHLTPDNVFEIIEKQWGYKKLELFDPCPENPQWNGLEIAWKPLNFVNPPYTLLREFFERAVRETEFARKTIMLMPAKTDQDWFHDIINNNFEIKWIRKRLRFKNHKWSATQPHFLVMIQ